MGETIPTWKPTCNPSVSVRLSGRKNSSDGGAFLLREVMDRSGLCERLDQQLTDSRDPARIRHSLSSQVRTLLIQRALGWDDLSDTQLLGQDPVNVIAQPVADEEFERPDADEKDEQRKQRHARFQRASA